MDTELKEFFATKLDAITDNFENKFSSMLDRFDKVDKRLDLLDGKMDKTNERTIINSQMIEQARGEIQAVKETQGRCAEYEEKHREEDKKYCKEYADLAVRDGVKTLKIGVLTAFVTAVVAVAISIITSTLQEKFNEKSYRHAEDGRSVSVWEENQRGKRRVPQRNRPSVMEQDNMDQATGYRARTP